MCPYDISQNQFHMNYSEGNFSGIYKMRSYCSSGRAEELLDPKIGVFQLEVDGRELKWKEHYCGHLGPVKYREGKVKIN